MAKRKKEVMDVDDKFASGQMVLSALQAAQEAEFDIRDLSRQCVLFCIDQNGQWEPYWWNANADKPRYTLDLTTPLIDQIMAEVEQASFDIRVSPAGGDATKETALVYDGLIRSIENLSEAGDIYRGACRQAVMGGFAAWRVVNKYVSPDSFDQDLIIEGIANPLDRVWFDPAAEKQDKSDAEWCVILHAIAKKEYDEKWPEGSGSSVGEGRTSNAYYYKPDVVIVGEILYCREYDDELVLMSNGSTYSAKELEKDQDKLALLGVTELKRRKTERKKCYSRFFDGGDWLQDEEETPFDRIPVTPIYMNYNLFEDKQIYYGHVMRMLDPQRILNYSISREIEEGALAPRPKYWMTFKQAEGVEDSLATMNTNSNPVQFYTFDPDVPGPPQQQGGAKINEGLRTITESMRQMIGQVGGMFAANMGDNPGLQSGVAINAIQNKGDNGTVKFFKALETAITYTGKIIVAAIPKVYDTRRQKRLMYEDGTAEVKTLNDEYIDPMTGQMISMNDLSKGTYDVVCKAGPSFRNRQEETTQVMLELAKVDPELFQIGGDLFLKNLATPVADQLAERKRAQMIAQGLIPESQLTDEEKQQLAQKQGQPQAPDPNVILAQSEMLKSQALMLDAQNKQASIQLDQQKLEVDTKKFMAEHQVTLAEAQAQVSKSATEQQLTTAKIKTEDAKVALEAEKLRLEAERLALDKQIAAAEFAIKQEQERNKLALAAHSAQMAAQKPTEKPKRKYNRQTKAIE